jgi:hypothetical protein
MSPKIHSSFWRDDDVWALAPEHKLAFLWLLTNGRTNNAGFLVVSLREFTQDTRLSEEALEGACKGLARGILREGRAFWIRHFMRHQWTPGERGLTSRLYNSLCNAVAEMPTAFVTEAVKEYPELYSGVKALVSPLKALPPPEGACKGLEGPRAEQSRAEQSTEGEYEGKQSAASPSDSSIGPAVSEKRNGTPALAQALEFCRKHIQGYAEEEIIAAWHSLEATRDEHGRWFIGKLVVGDWRSGLIDRMNWHRNQKKNGSNPVAKRLDLEAQQRNLRQLIADSPANESSAAFRLDHTDAESEQLRAWKRRDREIVVMLAEAK